MPLLSLSSLVFFRCCCRSSVAPCALATWFFFVRLSFNLAKFLGFVYTIFFFVNRMSDNVSRILFTVIRLRCRFTSRRLLLLTIFCSLRRSDCCCCLRGLKPIVCILNCYYYCCCCTCYFSRSRNYLLAFGFLNLLNLLLVVRSIRISFYSLIFVCVYIIPGFSHHFASLYSFHLSLVISMFVLLSERSFQNSLFLSLSLVARCRDFDCLSLTRTQFNAKSQLAGIALWHRFICGN